MFFILFSNKFSQKVPQVRSQVRPQVRSPQVHGDGGDVCVGSRQRILRKLIFVSIFE